MTREEIEELIYGKPEQQHRFTQDFPILPDVWIAYAELPTKRREAIKQNKTSPSERIELLLTPHKRRDAASLARALRRRWEDEWDNEKGQIARYRAKHPPKDLDFNKTPRILFNEAVVFADFTLEELLRVAMPLTDWWKNNVAKPLAGWRKAMDISASPAAPWTREDIQRFVQELQQAKTAIQGAETKSKLGGDPRLLKKLIIIIGAIERDRHEPQDTLTPAQDESFFSEDQSIPPELVSPFLDLLEGLTTPAESRGLLYGISQNRPANTSIWRSRLAIKADAAARVFEVDTSGICWAVLDAGIDARHEAFARRKKGAIVKEELDENGMEQFASRVVRTYDFLRIKDLLNPNTPIRTDGTYAEKLDPAEREHCKTELKHNLDNDKAIDWDLIEPFLRIPHVDRFYDQYQAKVKDGHGTHVAGIIAANWPEAPDHTSLENGLFGICQDLEIYDLRVLGFDDQRKPADEFTIIAALQFIRHLNAHRDLMAIHGVNLSMAVTHDVANYACGRTPICEECQRVVANGVVVVTAAGNRGFNKLANPCDGVMGDYRYISITDPGNAENVITVGSTHRYKPHNYGVSYFSSRGPTGDGRTKPDLVAPGERIDSCTPGNNFETMDGTSMAAPHVSGAAALLIARHRELIGQPERVKEILTKSATDLGREPRFQGAGMLDVLRALQSV